MSQDWRTLTQQDLDAIRAIIREELASRPKQTEECVEVGMIHVSHLGLSKRALRGLNRLGISTIKQLTNTTPDELMETKNFGMTSLTEVRDKLRKFNFCLKNDLEELSKRIVANHEVSG